MADEKETVILEFQVDTKDAIVSIENLTKANKELRDERKKLDTSTKDGQDRIKEINQQLDQNTNVIKNNVSALEKQKINIGNYSGALDKLVPGLGATANGIANMTKEAYAFILTGWGAIILGIGLAISALTAYFKGSEEGQDRLAKITAVLTVAMNKLQLILEGIGEELFNVGNGTDSIIDKMGIFGSAIKVALAPLGLLIAGLQKAGETFTYFFPEASKAITGTVDDIIEQGKKIADLQDSIESRENELIVKRAQVNKQVSELREKALKQEGDQKRATIQEAINLEKGLADEEVKHSQDKLKLIDLENASTGKLTEEQKKQRSEATADIINQESQRAEATLKFTKQIEKLKDDEDKHDADLLKGKILREKQYQDDVNKGILFQQDEKFRLEQEASEKEKQDAQDSTDFMQNLVNWSIDQDHKATDIKIGNANREADAKKKLALEEKANNNEKLGDIIMTNQKVAQLNAAAFGNNKDLAAANAGVSMWVAASKDLEKGWPLGAILAAIDIATGLANIAHIEGIGFAQGGYTGMGNPNDPAGTVHKNEFVMPNDIVNKFGVEHFQSYLDGSVIANAASRLGGNQQAPIQVNLGLKEFNEFKNKVEFKESLTSV